MGVSCAGVRRIVVQELVRLGPRSVLDLGCGIGFYGEMIRKYLVPEVKLYGVDGYMPYLYTGNCRKYDALIKADVFDVVEGRILAPADVVICMDVVEHFERPQASRLLAWLRSRPAAFMSTPLFWFEQDPSNGNELERHRSSFTEGELLAQGWALVCKVRWDGRGDIGAFRSAA